MNDNDTNLNLPLKDVEFAYDDRRRVYAIPVKLTLECTLFILATDTNHAVRAATLVDLQDYFAFDTDSLHTDSDGLLKINDVHTSPILVSVVDLTQLTSEEYPPNTHPDFVGVSR